MSEQRFVLDKLYYSIMTPIEKISVGRCYMTYREVVDTLNEQQATIKRLEEENDDLRFALRTEQAFARVEKDKKPFLSKEEFLKELEEDEREADIS